MRRALALLTAAAALSVGPITAATAAGGPTQPGLGIRLMDAPANLVSDPRARSYIIDHLPPGRTVVRHLEVYNDTGAAAHILLYPDAASIQNGEFTAAPGRSPNELTSWITVSPAAVDLPNGGTAVATVTIAVPAAATAGERYATILADLPAHAVGSGLALESRVGIRVYLSIGSGAAPPTNFTIDSLTALRLPDGQPEVRAMVHNVGGRAIDLTGQLKLSDGPGGLSAGPFPVQLGTTLAPGQTEPATVLLDPRLPDGPWHALLVLHSDLVSRAASGVISFPSTPGTANPPVKAQPVPLVRNRHFVIPLAIGLLLLVLLALLLVLWRRRRNDDDDRHQPHAAPVVPAQRRPARRSVLRQ